MTKWKRLQTTQPTSGGAVTANSNCCANCVEPPRPQQWGLLPEDIVCKITQRNNIRRANTCDPALKLLNEEITSDIQKHKQNIWKEHLDAHGNRRHNTHTLWKTIHGLSNRAPPHTLNTSITFNNKSNYTHTHCELFHQTIHKHCQARNTQNKQTH